MSVKMILFASAAAAVSMFAASAPASAAPYYRCGDGWCYDDQAEATRELNLMQLEHPGAGVHAVPGYHDDSDDDDDDYGRGGEKGAHMEHRHGGMGGMSAPGDDQNCCNQTGDDDQYGDDDQDDNSADDNDDDDDDGQ
jgi:hypothetical protein